MTGAQRLFAKKTSMVYWLVMAAVIVLLDQLTKILIVKTFAYGEYMPITSFFNLVLVHNQGAAFSFLASESGWQRYFFTAISLAAVVYIVILLRKHNYQRMFCWALTLILGGAIGNLIDRILYGYVIDFLDFYISGWHWPAFNVADAAICIGAALFLLEEFTKTRR